MPAVLQSINHPLLRARRVSVVVKRDDLKHPIISGNKAFKLKYNMQAAQEQSACALVTFGGAYSNHLHATAYAAKRIGLPAVAVVRGEQILPLNHTLQDCINWGMTLHPVSRLQYKEKNTEAFRQWIEGMYGNVFWIPEGGANQLGVKGAQEILSEVDQSNFDYIIAACGTGTTLAGLINGAEEHVKVIGVPVLKNASWLYDEIKSWVKPGKQPINLWLDYHFGGYAKATRGLLEFIEEMQSFNIPLDFVYTAKALFALFDQIDKQVIPSGSRVLFCHTGGLQGMRSHG